jgi:predicted kinase
MYEKTTSKPMNTGFVTGKEPRSGWKNLISTQGIDWQGLAELPWVQDMQQCPQEPDYHAEGDVWTHTRMVLEALLDDAAFQAQPETVRERLLYAALLHDVAKPACTRVEEGRIVSPGHARLGEKMTRELLWDMPHDFREDVCALVRLHGLPLWGLEKTDPARSAILASWRLCNEQLYLLTRADILGRICPTQSDLLFRLDLYRELCLENDCWEAEHPWYNAHSRHKYFWSDASWPVELYDDSRFDMVVLCGLPGSGKDTWARRHLPALPVVSLDAIRELEAIDHRDASAQGRVAQLAYEQAKTYCRAGQPFVWNSTNLSAELRARLIRTLGVYRPRIRMVYLETSLARVLERRSEAIPRARLGYMLRRLDIPLAGEGHTLEWVREGRF